MLKVMTYETRPKVKAKEVSLPSFTLIGFELMSTTVEFDAGLGKETHHKLLLNENEVSHKKNLDVFLLQQYPKSKGFDPTKHQFRQMLAFEVLSVENVPEGMVVQTIPENRYIRFTHKGPDSLISNTYNYIYSTWFKENNKTPGYFDFEVWGSKYNPESHQNEVEIFVSLI